MNVVALKQFNLRLETEILAALEHIRERDGVAVSEQVRRALKGWIAEKGVTMKSERKRVSPRRRP